MHIDFGWLEEHIFRRPLSSFEKAILAELIEFVEFRPGAAMLMQDEPGDALYLLYAGKADVLMRFDGDEVRLGRVGEGAQIGDMSLIDAQFASATVRASERCTAYRLGRDAMSRLFLSHHDLARDLLFNTIRGMAGIIRNMNQSAAATQSYIRGRRV